MSHLLRTMFSFERTTQLIKDNGGQIAELDDAKLTHVALDKRDDSRRHELMKKTSKYGLLHLRSCFLSYGTHTDKQTEAQEFDPL